MNPAAPATTAIQRTTDTPHGKVLSFLASMLALEGHQSAVKIDLSYSPPGGYRADPLRSWSREAQPEYFEGEDGKTNHVYTERLVTEIVEIAENHADSYGQGRHRFVVRVHQHLGGRQTQAFVILPTYEGEDNSLGGGNGAVELAPTQSGVVAQLMRHLENRDRAAQQTLQSFLGAINHHAIQMREENAELRGQLAAKDKERMEWLNTIEAARSTEHDRQIQAQIVVSKEERKTLATKKIINLLPVMLSRWLGSGKDKPKVGKDGKPVEKRPPSPLAKLVGKLIESLSDDQRTALGEVLSMEQQILFVEVVDVVENGDSVLLPTMLNDLMSTLQQRQVVSLMSLLSAEQREIFVKAVKLAGAQADPEAKETAGDKTTATNDNPETSE